MYDAKKLLGIGNALIRGYSKKYDRFLDECRKEWVREVESNLRREPVFRDTDADPGAFERQALLRELIAENETYCRRDVVIPDLEYERQMRKLDRYEKLREEAGRSPEFPTALAERALLCALRSELSRARAHLLRAIELNKSRSGTMPIRDNVRFLGDLARCCYLSGDYESAVAIADKSRSVADGIDPVQERIDYHREAVAPDPRFLPVAVHALFSACDARVNHPDWESSERIRREFSGLWDISVSNYNAPINWRPPMKIAVVSDLLWRKRVESYVVDIARSLHVELAPSQLSRSLRFVRGHWGGFAIEGSAGAAAAVAIVCYLTAGEVRRPFDSAMLDVEAIETVEDLIQGKLNARDLAEAYNKYLGAFATVEDAARDLLGLSSEENHGDIGWLAGGGESSAADA